MWLTLYSFNNYFLLSFGVTLLRKLQIYIARIYLVFFPRDLIPRRCVSQDGSYVDTISVAGHLEGLELLPLLPSAFVEYG